MRLLVFITSLVLCSSAAIAAPIMPGRGESMTTVLKHHGEPQQRLAAVGRPPISRWVYPEFTVYFEHRRVIHSVRHRDRSRVVHQPSLKESTP